MRLLLALLLLLGGRLGADPVSEQAHRLFDAGDFSAAAELYALAVEQIPEADPSGRFSMMLWHGAALHDGGDLAGAADVLRAAIDLGAAYPQAISPVRRGYAHNNLGYILADQGKVAMAMTHVQMALDLNKTALPSDDPDMLIWKANLADYFRRAGFIALADAPSLEAASMARQVFADAPDQLAAVLAVRAKVLMDLAREEALPLLREVLAIDEGLYPEEHLYLAISRHDLAMLLWKNGEAKEAETLLQKVLAAYEAGEGLSHPYALQSVALMIGIWLDRGAQADLQAAFRLYAAVMTDAAARERALPRFGAGLEARLFSAVQ